MAGQSDFFRSQSDTIFDLSTFGISMNTPNVENSTRIGILAGKIRRDVRQLGLLCAASDKEKLINVLIINQQLNIIDPPLIELESTETPEQPRTIKSVLKPPTIPQRVKPKRNMNLKISYGVVTAKEVVQSLVDREEADRQHAIEREKDNIAKIERENTMAAVEEEMKNLRKLLSNARSENVAMNKEIAQKKKNKSIDSIELAREEAQKKERENGIKQYDDQLRKLRDKMKNLKSIHVATNKDVILKRKNFESQKKETGNKVQPPNAPPEIDDSESDADTC